MFEHDNADMPIVLKTYEDNDVDSMNVRRQLIQLRQHMQDGHYDASTTGAVSAFLHAVSYKLWGWGDFVRQLPDGSTVAREAVALQMTGAPGYKAKSLNGWYVETKEKHNGKATYKKTDMWKGTQHWIRYNLNKNWVVSTTQDVKDNNMKSLCVTTVHGDINPLNKQWKVYDADGDKEFKAYPDFKCEKITAADLLWELHDCDVVINALPASEIQHLINACLQLRMRHLHSHSQRNIIHHLENIGLCLQKMFTSRTADTLPETGQCCICMDLPASEIMLPCMHLCACRFCSLRINECPVCREPITTCNRRVYANRTRPSPQPVFDATVNMHLNILLLRLEQLQFDEFLTTASNASNFRDTVAIQIL